MPDDFVWFKSSVITLLIYIFVWSARHAANGSRCGNRIFALTLFIRFYLLIPLIFGITNIYSRECPAHQMIWF
jgi:hypothetical protein